MAQTIKYLTCWDAAKYLNKEEMDWAQDPDNYLKALKMIRERKEADEQKD